MSQTETQKIVDELYAEWTTSRTITAALTTTESTALPYDFEEIRKNETALGLAAVSAPAKHPVLVAEGDSWFDYPIKGDLLDALRVTSGYKIHELSKAGDLLENMVYGTERKFWGSRRPQIVETMEMVSKVRPSVILFSAGGNDIAGEELAAYINVKAPGVAPLREASMDNLIDVVFRRAFDVFIGAMQKVAADGGFSVKIVSHCYDYPFPDGRGYSITGWIPGFAYVGPWLKPTFSKKGYSEDEGRRIVKIILNKLADLHASLQKSHPGVFYTANFHGTLDPLSHHDWDNEMHPTFDGFKRVAQKMHQKIQSI